MGRRRIGIGLERFQPGGGAAHAQRHKQPVMEKLLIGLVGAGLHHVPDQREHHILVAITLPRWTNRGNLVELLLDLFVQHTIIQHIGIGMGHQARGVTGDVFQGDGAGVVRGTQVNLWEHLVDGRVPALHVLFHQQGGHGAGKSLGHGRDTKHGAFIQRVAGLAVAYPPGFDIQHGFPGNHRHRRTGQRNFLGALPQPAQVTAEIMAQYLPGETRGLIQAHGRCLTQDHAGQQEEQGGAEHPW